MNQSAWIAAAIVAAFLMFLAIKGKLGAYWSLLVGGGAPKGSPGATPASGASGASTPGTSPLDIAGGLVGGIGGGGLTLPGSGSSPTPTSPQPGSVTGQQPDTFSGTVTGSGQTSTQQWSLLPGVLPPLPSVSF